MSSNKMGRIILVGASVGLDTVVATSDLSKSTKGDDSLFGKSGGKPAPYPEQTPRGPKKKNS